MKRTVLTTVVLALLLTSGAWAGVTASLSYYSAEATATSDLYGADSDFQDGTVAVSAVAQVNGPLGNSTAQASGGLLNVTAFASVAVLPDLDLPNYGMAGSTAINAIIQLTADTNWGFTLNVFNAGNQSAGGSTAWEGLATLTESGGSEIYHFSAPTDGLQDISVFGPGVYDLVLAASAFAEASTGPDGTFELAETSVSVSAQLFDVPGAPVVPVPAALWLGCLGIASVRALRRRKGLLN